MRKAAVRYEDRTSTGGSVVSAGTGYYDQGKALAIDGSKATCGTCQGFFPIYGMGSDFLDMGARIAVDGDRVLCPCGVNRVCAGSDAGYLIETRSGSVNARPSSAVAERLATAAAIYDERFVIRSESGEPVAGMSYRVTTASGLTIDGTTDAQGRTERIKTKLAETLAIELKGE